MTIIHKSKNSLKAKSIRNLLTAIVLYCIPLISAIYFTYFQKWKIVQQKNLLLPWGLVLVICTLTATNYYKQYKLLAPYLRGETIAMKMVADLPEGYHIFNGLKIMHGNIEREINLILVGKKGVFILEIKNYSGVITKNDMRKWWMEVKAHGQYLERYLKRRGINTKAFLVLFLSHQDGTLKIHSDKIPLIKTENQLKEHIDRSKLYLSNVEIRKIVKELSHLIDGK